MASAQPHVPAHRQMEKLVDAGTRLVVNSDVHVPALINAGRDEAYAGLDSIMKSHQLNGDIKS